MTQQRSENKSSSMSQSESGIPGSIGGYSYFRDPSSNTIYCAKSDGSGSWKLATLSQSNHNTPPDQLTFDKTASDSDISGYQKISQSEVSSFLSGVASGS